MYVSVCVHVCICVYMRAYVYVCVLVYGGMYACVVYMILWRPARHHESITPSCRASIAKLQVGCLLDQSSPPPPQAVSVCHVALTHNIESSLHRCGSTAGSVGGTAGVRTPVLHPGHRYGNGADIQVSPTGCGSRVRFIDWPRPHHRGGDRTADSAVQDGLLADAHHWNIQRHDNWWIYREGERDGGREGGKLRMEMFAVVNCYGCGCWEHNVTESCGKWQKLIHNVKINFAVAAQL